MNAELIQVLTDCVGVLSIQETRLVVDFLYGTCTLHYSSQCLAERRSMIRSMVTPDGETQSKDITFIRAKMIHLCVLVDARCRHLSPYTSGLLRTLVTAWCPASFQGISNKQFRQGRDYPPNHKPHGAPGPCTLEEFKAQLVDCALPPSQDVAQVFKVYELYSACIPFCTDARVVSLSPRVDAGA